MTSDLNRSFVQNLDEQASLLLNFNQFDFLIIQNNPDARRIDLVPNLIRLQIRPFPNFDTIGEGSEGDCDA